MKKLMMAAALMGVGGTTQAGDVGMAVSGTVNAGAQKVGEAVESVKGSYHKQMAKEDYEDAKKEMNAGNLTDAIEDASSSLVHDAEAKKADVKAEKHKKAADSAFHKAKIGAGVSVSSSADVNK